MPTAYTIEFLASIDRVISQERLSRYLAATNGDIGAALELYEHNIALSEALFGFLHGLEVAVGTAFTTRFARTSAHRLGMTEVPCFHGPRPARRFR